MGYHSRCCASILIVVVEMMLLLLLLLVTFSVILDDGYSQICYEVFFDYSRESLLQRETLCWCCCRWCAVWSHQCPMANKQQQSFQTKKYRTHHHRISHWWSHSSCVVSHVRSETRYVAVRGAETIGVRMSDVQPTRHCRCMMEVVGNNRISNQRNHNKQQQHTTTSNNNNNTIYHK